METREDPAWTARYHAADPAERAFGARAEIVLRGGASIEDELAVADAHPRGARPFGPEEYERKLAVLGEERLPDAERERFLRLARRLRELAPRSSSGSPWPWRVSRPSRPRAGSRDGRGWRCRGLSR